MSDSINVLLLSCRSGWADRVRAVDPRLTVSELNAGDFPEEGQRLYPPRWRNVGAPPVSAEERDIRLREAEIMLLGLPYPTQSGH